MGIFRELLMKSMDTIRGDSTFEELHALDGQTEVIRHAHRPTPSKADCVHILEVLYTRLHKIHTAIVRQLP
jgi:hypothetical protein